MGFFERSLTLGMCGLLVMVGLWYGLQGGYHWARSRAARRWPTVPGRVTAAGLDVYASASTYGTVARAAVEYEYRVDGERHIGRTISFGRLYQEQLGGDIPLPYPVGAAVTVYHHPRRPERAVLEPGPDAWAIGMRLAVGVMGIGMGTALAVAVLNA